MSAASFSSGFGLRHGTALIVAVLHAGLIYGFMHLQSGTAAPVKSGPLQVAILAEQQAPSPKLLPPPPPIVTPEPAIEPPVLNLPDLPAPDRAITVAYRESSAPVTSTESASPKLVSMVEYIRQPRPRYPDVSRRLREQGVVMLMVLIDEEGQACQIDVSQSSGHERLDKAAREAVAGAKFKPYLEDGIARPFFVLIPIEFGLNQRIAQR